MAGSSLSSASGRELRLRVISGAALAALALLALWAGGWVFSAMVALAVALLFREWAAMHRIGPAWSALGVLVLGGAVVAASLGRPGLALALVALATLGLALGLWRQADGDGFPWRAAGLSYAGLPAVALVWLRLQPDGLQLLVWTMAVVWATDILAYFSGRHFGGPKLAPRISPNKTWSGLGGGMAGAGLVGALLAALFWRASPAPFLLAGAGLAVVAQAGDFFESWLKRRAGVKDSGHLIPGHGGVMDRVDGLVPVSVVVAIFVFAVRLPAGLFTNCEGCSA